MPNTVVAIIEQLVIITIVLFVACDQSSIDETTVAVDGEQ